MDEIEQLIAATRAMAAAKTPSREIALVITKLDEAALWYGVDKQIRTLNAEDGEN